MYKKTRLILIISVIVLCAAGIGYYGFKFRKQGDVKDVVNTVKPDENVLKTLVVPKDRIKTIEGNKDVLYLDDDKIVYTENNDALKITDRKTNSEEVIKIFNVNNRYRNICSNGRYIAWTEWLSDSTLDSNGQNVLKIYDIDKKRETAINENKYDKSKNYQCQLASSILLKDNKIIYYTFDNNGENTIMSYDPKTNDKKIISKISMGKNPMLWEEDFDIDVDNGYMIFKYIMNDNEKSCPMNILTLVDLKNNKKKILLKTSDYISTSIEYPNVVFENKDTIHLYNIERNKDDLIIKCNEYPNNVDINDGYISWNENKIYVYSIKDKKKYEIDNGWFKGSPDSEGYKMISGDIMHWKDYCKVRYIKMSDIKQ